MQKSSVLFALILTAFNIASFSQVTFTEFTVTNNTHGPAGIYACDLDGDGDMDILSASIEDADINWFRNDGGDPIVWTKFLIDGNMTSAHSVHANDFDLDGDLDVVGTSYGSMIAWYQNNGGNPILWNKYVIVSNFTQAHEVYSEDMDDDGDFDVLGASSGLSRISLWINEGGTPVSWTQYIVDNACAMAKSVYAKDINGDDKMDIIGAALYDNDVKLYLNIDSQPNNWETSIVDAEFGGAHRVQGIDIDSDGDNDILACGYLNHQVAWWKNNGGSSINWTKQIIGTNFINACIVQAADMDGDGILDVVGTAQGINRVAWWKNNGGNPITWTINVITNDFLRPWPLYVCDIDNDGDNDVIAGSSYNGSNEIKLWRNDGAVSECWRITPGPNTCKLDCYPNPFNAEITIDFSTEFSEETDISIYNVCGQKIASVFSGKSAQGLRRFNWNAGDFPSGIYYIYAENEDFQEIRKVVLVK